MSLDSIVQALADTVPGTYINVDVRNDTIFYSTVDQADKLISTLTNLGGVVKNNDPITQGSSTWVATVDVEGTNFVVWYERIQTKEEKIAELQKQIEEIRGLE